MTITRKGKKKVAKRKNPCFPCNPSTRATRFARVRRNPDLTGWRNIEDVYVLSKWGSDIKEQIFFKDGNIGIYREEIGVIYNENGEITGSLRVYKIL